MGGDRTLTTPMIAGAAVGVVVLCALLFALVGALRGGDPAAPVIAGGQSPSAEATEQVGGTSSDPDGGSDTAGTTSPSDDETAASPSVDEPDATPSPAGDGDGDGGPATEPESTPTQDADDDATSQVDPAGISIQVLDAVGVDGGAAARATAEQLRSAGYDVIVVNGASRTYDVTTVFWSEGEGPGGRAVASTLDVDAARRTPDEVRLSDSVDVHVVVGLDRS